MTRPGWRAPPAATSSIVGRDYRFAAALHDATGGRGADVIYDGLGQAAARENLEALAMCGHWVSYGQASGPVDRLSVESIAPEVRDVLEPGAVPLHRRARDADRDGQRTFEALRQGTIRLDIRHRYPLAAAAQAHRDLESRTTIGPLICYP